MARFDVYENPDGPGSLLDVQAELLDPLNTRVVVPLTPLALSR
jgi:toxin CcdB